MKSEKRYLALGVVAVLAGVLVMSYAPGFAPQEPLTLMEGNGAEGQGEAHNEGSLNP